MKYLIRIMTVALFVIGALLSGCGSNGSGNGSGILSSVTPEKSAKVTITASFPADSGLAQKSVIPEGTTTIDVYYRTVKNMGMREQFQTLPDGSKISTGTYTNYTTIETLNTATTKVSLTPDKPSQALSLQPAEWATFVALAFDKDGILLGATSASGQLLPGNNDVRLTFLNGDWKFSTKNSFGNYTGTPVTLSDGTTFNGMQMGLNYNQLTSALPVGTVPSTATLQMAVQSYLLSSQSVNSPNSASFAINPVVDGKPQSAISGQNQYYSNTDYGSAQYQWAFSGAKTASSFSFSSNLSSKCSNGNGYYNSYGYGYGNSFRGASAIGYKFSSYSTCATPTKGDKQVSMSGQSSTVYSIFQNRYQPTQTFNNYTSYSKNSVTSGNIFENYLLTSNLSRGTGATADMNLVYPLQNSAVFDGTTITGNLFEMLVTTPYSYEIVKTSVAKAAKLADLAAMQSNTLDKARKAAQSTTNGSMTNIVYTDYAPVVIVTRKTDGTIDYGDWNIQGQTQTSTYNPTTLSYTYTYTRPAPLKDAKGTEFYPQNIAYLSPKVTWDSTAGKSVYTLPAKGGLDYPISLPTGKTNIGDWCDGNSSQVQTYDPKTRTYSIDRTKCGKPEYGANGVVEPYEFITLSSSTSGGSVSAYPSGTGVYKTVAATTTTTPQINYGDFVISAYLKTSETYNAYSYPVTLKGKPTPISYRARVTDWATGLVGIDGISVTTIGLIPEISTTTDANGYFTISAIPRGVSFTIKLNKATYSDVYTARISFTGSNDSSSTPYNMILPADFATIGSTTGTGVISSSVRDSSNGNPLSGVVVTATDSANSATTYPVVYRSDTTGTWDTTLTSTSSRGQWRVLNIPAGKTVTVTAKLAVGSYYTFGTRTFDVKADSLSQTTLRGTAVTVTVLK